MGVEGQRLGEHKRVGRRSGVELFQANNTAHDASLTVGWGLGQVDHDYIPRHQRFHA